MKGSGGLQMMLPTTKAYAFKSTRPPQNPQKHNEILYIRKTKVIYNCTFCPLRFITKDTLKIHFRCHEGKIPREMKRTYWKSQVDCQLGETSLGREENLTPRRVLKGVAEKTSNHKHETDNLLKARK